MAKKEHAVVKTRITSHDFILGVQLHYFFGSQNGTNGSDCGMVTTESFCTAFPVEQESKCSQIEQLTECTLHGH